MAKRYIWLEETNQRINEFSIGYTMNPNLNINKAFREQVKVCLKNKISTSTMTHISKILLKTNKRVNKMFRVLSCVMYTIISKYVCIDYLGSEKSKLSDLRLGVTGRYKHLDKIMTTYRDLEFQIYY